MVIGLPLGEVPEEELRGGPVSSMPSVLLLGLGREEMEPVFTRVSGKRGNPQASGGENLAT